MSGTTCLEPIFRPPQTARRRAAGALLSLSVLGGLAAGSASAGRVAQPAAAGGRVALVAGAAGTLIVESEGTVRRLDLPAGASLGSVAATTGGWIAAGTLEDRDRTDLYLLESRDGHPEEIEPPGGRRGRLVLDPLPLAESGDLAGLVWLDGSGTTSLAVRAARREGAGWAPPETVAAPGPGSQAALSATVLEDGSWLLVWSAFDGEDDEILWSHRTAQGWSAPARLHPDNAVPDITPAVASLGVEALAAWSRFEEGHYRMRVARFDGAAWREADFRGEAGSLFPTFVAEGDAPRLLYRTVEPAAWTLLDLGRDGLPWRRLTVPAAVRERPLVEGRDTRTSLRWLGEDGRTLRRATGRWAAAP